jgi:hypothetical protein
VVGGEWGTAYVEIDGQGKEARGRTYRLDSVVEVDAVGWEAPQPRIGGERCS